MDLQHFQQMIAAGEPLRGEEMIAFMREQSDNTHRLLFDLNNSYHTPEEIVALFSRITDSEVHESFRMFPPFYTDCGRNIHIGNNVFIGANTTIEIGTIGITIIEDNVKVDDLVQIGHNSSTGMNTLITVGSILCGGVVVEENCYVAPNVTIREKVHVARNSFLGMGTVVIRDVDAGSTIIGNPGRLLIK